MNKSDSLEESDLIIIKKQIRAQEKGIILFPFIYAVVLFLAFARNNGKMPQFYFYIITIPFLLIPGIYSPISKALRLSKTIYAFEILNENAIRLTTFGTLWRNEKIILADLKDIKADKTPLPKLLYKKYLLNTIYISGKKYYIFNEVLEESGI